MTTKIRRKEHWIDLDKPTIQIAIAQINGPFPDAKRKVVSNGREVLEWTSLDDMNFRVEKALGILDELSKIEHKPDLVVFPEYSFPSFQALPQIIERANKYGFIIIAGADARKNEKGEVLNQSPIIIPEKKTIFVTKRKISKWEIGLVDEPKVVTLPILKWKVKEQVYSITPYICLEFELATYDHKKGGGIFIVPMCSPEVYPFHLWGDSLLRLEGGSATILCNCVGESTKGGSSSVIAVMPGASPGIPAFKLSESNESVAIVEINCQNLFQPIKTNSDIPPPLGHRFLYNIHYSPEGILLLPSSKVSKPHGKKGVINPSIYDFLGKTMRIAFLSVPKYADISEKIKTQDFEVLAILGHHDLMVTHLTSDRYDMIVDISSCINWKTQDGGIVKSEMATDNTIQDKFPHFRVDSYFKVLGEPVKEKDRNILAKDKPFPSLEEITLLMKLGRDWNTQGIDEATKEKFKKNRWIINVTDKTPGSINGIMTIHLDHADVDKGKPQLDFEEEVIPQLVQNKSVTSIYGGVGHGLRIDYLLRLSLDFNSSDLTSLYNLIETVHAASKKARVLISTTTYVAVNKLADLSLEKAALLPQIPPREKKYRDAHIYPYLLKEEKLRLIYMHETEQIAYINQFRQVEEALNDLIDCEWKIRFDAIKTDLATGFLDLNWFVLKNVHESIYTFVENELKIYIEDNISEEYLDNVRDQLQIKSGTKKDRLSYTERLKLVSKVLDTFDPVLKKNLVELQKTTLVRNAFAHSDWERLSFETFIDAMITYCNFLLAWHRNIKIEKK